jgi:hypothetical protein
MLPSSARPDIQKLPATVDDLIDELDRLVPEVIPSADESLISIQRHAGKRELVVFLKLLRSRRDGPPRVRERKR